MTLNPRQVVRSLGGIVISNTSALVPGPGHSDSDRSLSIKFDRDAPDGFLVYSFAGDSLGDCRSQVLAAFGLKARRSANFQPRQARAELKSDADRSADALRLWNDARDPSNTIVASYLLSRGLTLPDDIAKHVVRFHPSLKYDGSIVGGMVALFRDLKTNAPCGVQRTFLDAKGHKLDRRMLGRAHQAAIKIDADECVTVGLTIGEGFETCLAAWLAGFRPVWATGSASSIAKFAVLPGVEAITILGEAGDGGANDRASEVCVNRWLEAGQEVFVATPLIGDDLNDAWREAVK